MVLEQHGAQVRDVEVPDGPYEEVAELTILVEAVSSFEELIHSGRCSELTSSLGQINGYVSEEISAADYLRIQRIRTFLQRKIDRLFDDFDVLATAGESGPADPLNAPPEAAAADTPIERRAPDGFSSLCGLPAITVPCGFTPQRLPFAVQFVGRALRDDVVVSAAQLYQSFTDWHLQHPPSL
jgi:aspartyl-tRNA(Asn)/glutamyl-tRNA(Gln) amidotransferase subunit A